VVIVTLSHVGEVCVKSCHVMLYRVLCMHNELMVVGLEWELTRQGYSVSRLCCDYSKVIVGTPERRRSP